MRPFLFRYFISWWLNAVDEHSLHSPFFYDFYVKVIKRRTDEKTYRHIDALRKRLSGKRQALDVDAIKRDGHSSNKTSRISNMASTHLPSPELSVLYYRLVRYIDARNIVELGSPLGINSIHLAENKNARIFTFEGSSRMASTAGALFDSMGLKNIKVIEGNTDKTLPDFLSRSSKPDLVIIDGNNHDMVIQSFRLLLPHLHAKSIISIHGIHSSREMNRAWEEIKANKLVYGSADLLRCGLVFFDPSLNKQNVVLQC